MKRKPNDISPKIRNLYENLRLRPGLYIGCPGGAAGGYNLTLFVTFIQGMSYYSYVDNNYVCNKELVFIPDGFNEFVADYYKTNLNANSYYSLILCNEPGEVEAFDKFWELLNKFLVSLGYEPIQCEKIKTEYMHENGMQRIYWVDLDELSCSYMQTFPDWDKATTFKRLRDMYLTSGFSGTAFWKESKPIGAVMGKYEKYSDGKYFQITEFWIEPEYQHKGYAKELLTDLIKFLKNCDFKKIYVINLHDDNAEGFFRHFGFEIQKSFYTLLL